MTSAEVVARSSQPSLMTSERPRLFRTSRASPAPLPQGQLEQLDNLGIIFNPEEQLQSQGNLRLSRTVQSAHTTEIIKSPFKRAYLVFKQQFYQSRGVLCACFRVPDLISKYFCDLKVWVKPWIAAFLRGTMFQIIIAEQNMQVQLSQRHLLAPPALHKAASLPSLSARSPDDEPRRLAARWVLAFCRKVSRDTQYLAIAYLGGLQARGVTLTLENYEVMAAATLLIASKMNEIYPPKISGLLARCRMPVSREELVVLEGRIVAAFDYEVALPDTVYSLTAQVLGELHADKLEECEKLLRMVATSQEVHHFGEEALAYAVVYLILPQLIRELHLQHAASVKALALKIYRIYQENKWRHEKQKENHCNNSS